jgi:hypothetical protein
VEEAAPAAALPMSIISSIFEKKSDSNDKDSAAVSAVSNVGNDDDDCKTTITKVVGFAGESVE